MARPLRWSSRVGVEDGILGYGDTWGGGCLYKSDAVNSDRVQDRRKTYQLLVERSGTARPR